LYSFVAAFVGDGLALGSEGGGGEQNDECEQEKFFHGEFLCAIASGHSV
jgi:hypothetical protein